MASNTGPFALPISEAERIDRLERIIKVLREGKADRADDVDIVAVINAIGQYSERQPKNGWAGKIVNYVLFPLIVIACVGGVKLYHDQGVLEAEISKCQKIIP